MLACAGLCVPPGLLPARPRPASRLPRACFLGSLTHQQLMKKYIEKKKKQQCFFFAIRDAPPCSPLACLRAPSGLLPGQPHASKQFETQTHLFFFAFTQHSSSSFNVKLTNHLKNLLFNVCFHCVLECEQSTNPTL